MSDRFKFRAWDKTENAYIEDAQFTYDDGCEGGMGSFRHYSFRDLLEDKNCIVEQCTGLKDKNGKLIFEGDILTDGANTFTVNWYEDMALFRILYKNDNRETYCLFYPDDAASKYTVIGNIHEEL